MRSTSIQSCIKGFLTDIVFSRFTFFQKRQKTISQPLILQYRQDGVSQTASPAIRHHRSSIITMGLHLLIDSVLTALCSTVRKRCTSTWSLSATSIPASPPPLVSSNRTPPQIPNSLLRYYTGHLIYKCGGIDKRTIEKFEKVRTRHISLTSPAV